MESEGGEEKVLRRKFWNKMLSPVDYTALTIAFVAFIAVGLVAIFGAFRALEREWSSMCKTREGQIALSVSAVCFLWCFINWKRLNKRRSPFD